MIVEGMMRTSSGERATGGFRRPDPGPPPASGPERDPRPEQDLRPEREPEPGREPEPTATGGGGGPTLEPLGDSLLARRAAEGDDDAFEVLVHRHGGSLLTLAHHLLGNRADAEEAVQEALVSAWRRLPSFRREAAFRTWMYRIVTNRCLSVLRARAPDTGLESVPEPVARDAGGMPARAAEAGAATEALARALRHLPPEQRACWLLREVNGLSYEEIAQVSGRSEQTVRGRLFRARRTLTEEMAPWR